MKQPDPRFIAVGRLRSAGPWSMKAHSHPFFEMIVVMAGAMRVRMLGEETSASAGEVLLYPAGVAHQERSEPGAPFHICYASFQWELRRKGLSLHVRDDRGRIRELVTWLHEERDAYGPSARSTRQSFLSAMVAEYARAAERPERPLVERIREHVRSRMAGPVTLDDLAGRAGLSKYHFVRLYRSLTGLTPMADVRRMRVEEARNLILTTDLPLKAVAPRVGLASEYHLSRLLRKHLDMSARELRRSAAPPG